MILWLIMAVAAAAQLSIELESGKLQLGQTVPLTLQLVNGSLRGQPEVPVGEGLSIRYTGQSSQKVVVNFEATDIVRYNYQLTALRPGTWSIGPVNLGTGSRRLHAAAVAVEVSDAPATTGQEVVVASVSESSLVLGQVVVYRFTFRHEKPLVDAGWTQPTFDGFVEEQIAEPAQREYRVEEDGKTYKVQTVDVPLVAAGEGERSIPPAVLTAKYRDNRRRRNRRRGVDDLFRDSPFATMRNVRTMTHSTLPVPVEIQPLPTGAPANFGGLVGQFEVEVRTDTRRLALGESATLEYRIQGNGTLSGFRLPPLASDAGFRVYDDAAEIKAGVVYDDAQGGVPLGRFLATALVRRAVVPEATGTLTVPSVRIPVFDPARGVYDTLVTPSVVLQVDPGESGAGVVESYAGQGGVKQRLVASLGEDILPVTTPGQVSDATARAALPVMVTLPTIPLLVWLSALLLGWVQTRRVNPAALLQRRLRELPNDSADRLATLESIFLEAAGLRLHLPAPGLDRDAIAPLGETALTIYDALVQARYGGVAAQLDDLESQIRAFVAGCE